jgi:hypothetical protein
MHVSLYHKTGWPDRLKGAQGEVHVASAYVSQLHGRLMNLIGPY